MQSLRFGTPSVHNAQSDLGEEREVDRQTETKGGKKQEGVDCERERKRGQ